MLYCGSVMAAPCRAKWAVGGSIGGLFLLSAAIGLLIGYLAFHE